MERPIKEKSLARFFIDYLILYAVSTLMLCAMLLFGLIALGNHSWVLPANMQELALSEHMEDIRIATPEAVAPLIPEGATYGVYTADGKWICGTIDKDRRHDAWARYEMREYAPDDECFYKFIPMDQGTICIARYEIGMRYTKEPLNTHLPSPEHLLGVAMVFTAIGNLIYCARRFARTMQKKLKDVQVVSAKIATNNLAFDLPANTGICEINEVMRSLETLKEALQTSLTTQWQKEQQKEEQLAALAHDIKTPLTVIRGNAELLQEMATDTESRDCADYIVDNAIVIDSYLAGMRAVLRGEVSQSCESHMAVQDLVNALARIANELANAHQLPLKEKIDLQQGTLCLVREDILRAWRNVVDNAVGVTDPAQGLHCNYRIETKNGNQYLVASVGDHGPGLSAEALRYATNAFYIGDKSRHTRAHQGLGLAIAKDALLQQGGFLTLANAPTGGAEVSLWLKLENQ